MFKLALYLIVLVSSTYACALCGSNKTSFINVSTHTIFAHNSIEKIEVVWKFDEFFSAQLITLYDKNSDAHFDEQETHAMFQLLRDVEKPAFMSVISINNAEIKAFEVSKFQATINDKIVSFTFDIALNCPIDHSAKLLFYFFDSSRSLAFLHVADSITYTNTTPYTVLKNFGFKVIQNTMSVVNTISYEAKE